MNKVSESIWSNLNVVIPMADVQHIEKKYYNYDSADGSIKKDDLSGIMVITKHTTWKTEIDYWENAIWIANPEAEKFIKAFSYYRYELEGGEKAFKKLTEKEVK